MVNLSASASCPIILALLLVIVSWTSHEVSSFVTPVTTIHPLSTPSFSSSNQEGKLRRNFHHNLNFNLKPSSSIDDDITDVGSSFLDPFQLKQKKDSTSALKMAESVDGVNKEDDEEDESDLGIWASRGILLVVAVIWATNFPAVKYLETLCFSPPCNHPPSEFALARFGVAALVSLPLLVRQRTDIILAGFECGLFITLGYITQAVALSSISAGKCAFICSLTVVVVPLLSAVLEGKPIKPMNLVAAVMALCGVGLLEGLVDFNTLLGIQPAVADTALAVQDAAVASSSSIEAATAVNTDALSAMARTLGVSRGDIIALGQPLGFGYTFMRIEHYVEKFKDVENRVLTLSAAQCVCVGFFSLLWVLYDFHGTIPNMGYLIEPHRIATIAWTGIVTTIFAIYLEGIALQKATATDAALTFASEPVWASIFAVILLHETVNLNAYIGGAVILIACVVGAVSDIPTDDIQDDVQE